MTSAEALARLKQRQADLQRQAEAFADDYIKRLDKNGDGSVTTHELPRAVQRFAWFDHNDDDHVSRDELIQEALWRLQQSP